MITMLLCISHLLFIPARLASDPLLYLTHVKPKQTAVPAFSSSHFRELAAKDRARSLAHAPAKTAPEPQYRAPLSPEDRIIMELDRMRLDLERELQELDYQARWREYEHRTHRRQRLLLEAITGYRIPPWLWNDD